MKCFEGGCAGKSGQRVHFSNCREGESKKDLETKTNKGKE